MQTKYDEYMKKELPYRMTLEELFEYSNNGEYFNTYDVLAYIRERRKVYLSMSCINTF